MRLAYKREGQQWDAGILAWGQRGDSRVPLCCRHTTDGAVVCRPHTREGAVVCRRHTSEGAVMCCQHSMPAAQNGCTSEVAVV